MRADGSGRTRRRRGICDTRIALIEKSRGRRMSDTMRERVTRQIRAGDEECEKARRDFVVPDQTGPSFLFRPVRRARGRGGSRRDG